MLFFRQLKLRCSAAFTLSLRFLKADALFRMKLSFYLLTFFGLLLLTISSCEVETEFLTGETVQLRFSTDTLTFDTVFTARGSATRQFKVYNDGDQPIMIDRIRVDGQTGVNYTFNVDGTPGPEAEDIVIFGNDSIFVFVEVEVDPTEPEEISPFIAEDFMLFELGTVQEEVTLLAYGQNAVVFGSLAGRGQFFTPCMLGEYTFPTDLPVVIFGSWVITDCVVRAEPGTRIYVHGGVQRNPDIGFFNDGIIFVEATGRLDFRGTLEEPVIMATDRLEEEFLDAPAKYRGIILGAGSRNNRMEHTQILNSIVGVTMDSAAELTLQNSVIAYSGGSAISAFDADLSINNSVFHSNFGNALQILRGGNLSMDYTTIANYGVDASSLVLTNFDCDANNNCTAAELNATVRNSILSGSRGSEVILLDGFTGDEPDLFQVQIDNSVVRTDQNFLNAQEGLFADFYERICTGCYNLEFSDPLFQSIEMDDYQLDSLSVARNLALPINITEDLLGVARDGSTPDAGAFERVDQ